MDWGRNTAYTLAFAVVFLYVPFLVTAVLYCVILQTALKQRRRIEVIKVGEFATESGSRRSEKNGLKSAKKTTKEHKATLMIAFVVGTFCICWFPHSIGVFCLVDPKCNFNDSFYVLTTWLAMLNSAMNSLIYGLMNRSFRRAFKSVIFCERYVGNADLVTNIIQEKSNRKSYGNVTSYNSKCK